MFLGDFERSWCCLSRDSLCLSIRADADWPLSTGAHLVALTVTLVLAFCDFVGYLFRFFSIFRGFWAMIKVRVITLIGIAVAFSLAVWIADFIEITFISVVADVAFDLAVILLHFLLFNVKQTRTLFGEAIRLQLTVFSAYLIKFTSLSLAL